MIRAASLVGAALCVATLADAQIDPSAPYRTLHTTHFRIHFQPGDSTLARLAARESERAYELLRGQLQPPGGTIDLVLADEFDFANGVATVWPTNRVILYLPPPIAGSIATFDSWLRTVMVHELTHIFHLDRTRGVWSVVRAVMGRAPGTFPNGYQPSWVRQGTFLVLRMASCLLQMPRKGHGRFMIGSIRDPANTLVFYRIPAAVYDIQAAFGTFPVRTLDDYLW